MRFLRKNLLFPVIAVVCLSVAFLATPPAYAASVHPPSGATVTVVHARMTLDCVHMTASVHHYAVTHGYCPTGNGVSYGNCGDSWIYIYDGGGGGFAAITYGFDSSLGPAAARNLIINWYNWDQAISGSYSDASGFWPPTANYSNGIWEQTGGGWVTTTMGGHILLAWGAVCDILSPSDGATISY
jgi:hypothetical protein